MPQEVILDRFVRTELRKQAGCSGYSGKLDIERVEPASLRSFLYSVQEAMNEALRSEGINASGGVEHPPFHFDYIDVADGTANAHAFQHEDVSFIVVTFPMIELLWRSSQALGRSPVIRGLLRLDPSIDLEEQGLLFQIQFFFLVSHEYTHHIHRHCVLSDGALLLWTEFRNDSARGDISSQAQELDADGYAAYLVLAHLLRGEMRGKALDGLGASALPNVEADELLLTCYFLALLAFFCTFWRGRLDAQSLYQFTHPPPPVRIKYAIQVAEMWCGQNESVPHAWFNPARFQELFRSASHLIGEATRQSWDAQMAVLRSAEGTRYDERLFDAFEELRHTPHVPIKAAPSGQVLDESR